jgi:hypothetical protein
MKGGRGGTDREIGMLVRWVLRERERGGEPKPPGTALLFGVKEGGAMCWCEEQDAGDGSFCGRTDPSGFDPSRPRWRLEQPNG